MEPQRFDAITKSLATRFSRRGALRTGGTGLAAGLLAWAGLGHVSARQGETASYAVIRKYTVSGDPQAVLQELNTGYLPLVQQAAGFVEYTVITSADNTLTTITIFASQADQEAAAQDEADWVQANLADLLPAPAETTSGDTVIYAVNTDVVCGDGPAPTEAAPTEAAPTELPATAEPTPCTGVGCPCNGGVQNACDEGLVCCQSEMGGGPIPGGEGMCADEDACGDGGATPAT